MALTPKLDRSEGDINISSLRADWQKRNLSTIAQNILQQDADSFLHQTLSTPCINVLSNAEGIYLTTVDGKKLMDFHGNNVHQVGFGNPYVVNAIKQQLEELPFCSRRYTNQVAIELAQKLTALAPGDLNKVLFMPAASLAMGAALKLARKATGRFKTISMWDSFHGATLDTISIGGEYAFKKDMGPMLTGAEHVMGVNTYRCIFGQCANCQMNCLKYLEFVLEKQGDVGAVIIETVRNTDVQIPDIRYMQGVREACNRHGALLILDETATAFGRTGKMFAFEHYDIVPDMVVVGKGLGDGIVPMAALIVREGLEVSNDIALGHYTHEKSPLGSAAALAMLKYLEDYDLLAQAQKLGAYFGTKLIELKEKYPLIGDVRQIGLLFAIELVTDRATKEKAIEQAEAIMYDCMENGLSFKVSQGNVITLSPPLIIDQVQLDAAYDILDQALQKVSI